MEKTKMTERILDLTLEIICLLTGESFLPLKAGDRVTITMPPPNTLILKGNGDQKILDVINKITELLTGEVPIRCQDVTVYFSMEEWEYLEGHKELYKDVMTEDKETQTSSRIALKEEIKEENNEIGVMEFSEEQKDIYKDLKMEDQPAFTSLGKRREQCVFPTDGSSNGNPPKRCSSPPYFGDFSQERYSSPQKDQDEELMNAKVEHGDFKDVKFEDGEPFGTKCEEEKPVDTKFEEEEPVDTKFEEEEPISTKFEDEEPIDTKAEGEEEEEESYMMGDQSIDEEVMMVTIKEENFSSDYELYGHANTSEGHPDLSPDGELEDYAEEDSRSSRPQSTHYDLHRFPGTSNWQGPSTGRGGCYSVGESSLNGPDIATPGAGGRGNEFFSCSECGKSFTSKSSLRGHQKLHTGERPFSCTVCGKTFIRRTHLNIHLTTHVGERPFKCTECGKGFSQNSDLRKHLFSHSGEFPFSCSDCGKGFPRKSELIRHRRSHTGERPYECTQCGKCFMDKSQLTAHKRYHSGERPYVCLECGKSFAGKSELNRHWSVHSGLKPFLCFECGKGFTLKSSLVTHQRRHAGDMQYSCSECGKSFVARSALSRHEVIHTGIKPYPCSKCNKSYLDKSQLIKHELVHAASQS